jgi:hypothetical protein
MLQFLHGVNTPQYQNNFQAGYETCVISIRSFELLINCRSAIQHGLDTEPPVPSRGGEPPVSVNGGLDLAELLAEASFFGFKRPNKGRCRSQ